MAYAFKGRNFKKVAVIGSGQIGPDIALYFSKVLSPFDVEIVVVDVVQEALDKGKDKLVKKIRKGQESGAFKPEQADQMIAAVRFTTDYDQVRGSDLILEAATENKELKRKIFTQLESLCDDNALLASNSSHLEPEEIFANLKNKSRSAVVHYFFPAERNPMIEVVPGKETSADTADFLMKFYEAIGKVPIRIKSRYGYAIDPIFEGLFLAALLLRDGGFGTVKEIDTVAAQALGLGIGPFTAMNLTGGNPITAVGLDHYTEKIMPWFQSPQSLKDMVAGKAAWETAGRGEEVIVNPERAKKIERAMQGAYFGLACEIVDSGISNIDDLNMGAEMALVIKAPFSLMNKIGISESLKLVEEYAAVNPGFKVPAMLKNQAASGKLWKIRTVIREDKGDVAVVTIRRPQVLNALDKGVFGELAEVFTGIKNDSDIKAAVLTGFGRKAFVSGADVKMLAAIQNPADGEATSWESNRIFMDIENLGKPIVCALNGMAFGGGNELAMCCSARIASKGQSVLGGQPEPNLGIIPGAGGSQRLPRLIGFEKAAMYLRTGRTFSSAEALSMGLISKEVEGDLLETAIQYAHELASGKIKSQHAQKEALKDAPEKLPELDIKHLSKAVDKILCRAILDGAKLPLPEALKLESKLFGEVCATKDMRIGVENFIKNGPRSKANFVHE